MSRMRRDRSPLDGSCLTEPGGLRPIGGAPSMRRARCTGMGRAPRARAAGSFESGLWPSTTSQSPEISSCHKSIPTSTTRDTFTSRPTRSPATSRPGSMSRPCSGHSPTPGSGPSKCRYSSARGGGPARLQGGAARRLGPVPPRARAALRRRDDGLRPGRSKRRARSLSSQRMCWLANANNWRTVRGRASRRALSSRSVMAPSSSSASKFNGGRVRRG